MSRRLSVVLPLLLVPAISPAGNIEIVLTADPSSNPVLPPGFYDPGEVIGVHACLRSLDGPLADIGLVQVDYSGPDGVGGPESGNGSPINWGSDFSKVAGLGLPLTLNPPGSPVFAAVTSTIPSAFNIPAAPACQPFVNFTAIVGLPFPTVIDVLGPSDADDATGAYITTSTFDTVWDNGDADTTHDIVGGMLILYIPEPALLGPLALGVTGTLLRRRAHSSSR